MKLTGKLNLITVTCISLLLYSCNKSTNWPEWRGENRDAGVKGFEAPAEWPGQLTTLWEKEVGLGNSSPVMVDSKLYLHVKQGESETALCLDAENGAEIWRTVLNPAPEVTGGARNHPGPRSTPCISGGKMFTVGVGGILTCLNAENGKLLWKIDRYTEVPQFYAAMSPIVAGNYCIAHLGGHDNGIVVAVNPENGEVVWTVENEPATYSSPVLMKIGNEEIVLVQTETDLIGISPDGSLLFKIPTPPERRFYNSSTPIVDDQNVIVAGQGVGTKSYQIEKKDDNYSFSENWINSDYGVSFNTAVLKDGYLYGHEARLGKLYCLNASTGKTAWADSTSHNRFAATLNAGEILMTLPATGNLIVFRPNSEEYVQIKEYKVSDTEVYAHPVISGNRIYVKDQDFLTCFSVE